MYPLNSFLPSGLTLMIHPLRILLRHPRGDISSLVSVVPGMPLVTTFISLMPSRVHLSVSAADYEPPGDGPSSLPFCAWNPTGAYYILCCDFIFAQELVVTPDTFQFCSRLDWIMSPKELGGLLLSSILSCI